MWFKSNIINISVQVKSKKYMVVTSMQLSRTTRQNELSVIVYTVSKRLKTRKTRKSVGLYLVLLKLDDVVKNYNFGMHKVSTNDIMLSEK